MIKVRLENLFTYREGSNLKAGDGKEEGKYPFFTSSNVQSKFIDVLQFQGEHLILGTGGKPSIHHIKTAFSTSSDCMVLQPNDKNHLFNPKFVYYYLLGNPQILEAGFRGAGLKHMSKTYVSNLIISLPSFGQQNKIVQILDKAYRIKESCNLLFNHFDQLEQSIYFSMFGEKVKDYSSWDLVKLSTLTNKKKGDMRTGPFGSDLLHSEFSETGDVRVLGIDNAVNNRFAWGEKRFITNEKYRKLNRYTIYPEDVLVTIMATVGKSAVVPKEFPLAINTKHLAALTMDRKLANPYFISFTLHSNPFIINQIRSKNRGAIMGGINLTVIKNLLLKSPPLSLQNKFEKLVRKIDSIRDPIKDKLETANFLIDVLNHDAFTNKLKTNSSAFSIDDQTVDFIEAKSEQKDIYGALNKDFSVISELIINEFRDRNFTFLELEQKVSEYDLDSAYDFFGSKDKGLKDAIFALLDSSNNKQSFLTQVFEEDKNRDAEKNIDTSHISFKISN